MISGFNEIVQASKGVVQVTVISAEALNKKTLSTLQTAIVGFVGKDKTIDMSIEVNESIIGGLQILVGDKFLDLSVNSRINNLTKTLEASN